MSTGAGFLLAGPPFALDKLVLACTGTALAAASASAFNQVYERHTDKLMFRTRHRPLPSGNVSVQSAVAWGVTTGVSSVALLTTMVNPLTAALAASNIVLYSAVYTPMKQTTTWNTWVGAVVGAIPPVMGYTAVTNSLCAVEPIVLSTGLFLWQFPHFFALAWLYKDDYARGGHRMVPVVDPTGVRTGRILTSYAAVNSALPFAAYGAGATSIMFPIESLVFNAYMMWACRRFQQQASDENARRVFKASLWYLPVFMGLMVFHGQSDRRSENQEEVIAWPATFESARLFMRDLCLHERVVTRVPENAPRDDHPGLCPVTTVERHHEEAKAVVAVVKGAAASSGAL